VISDFTKDLVKISPIARAVRQASIASDIKDLRSRFLAAGILFDVSRPSFGHNTSSTNSLPLPHVLFNLESE
jgi:hypothetical protein